MHVMCRLSALKSPFLQNLPMWPPHTVWTSCIQALGSWGEATWTFTVLVKERCYMDYRSGNQHQVFCNIYIKQALQDCCRKKNLDVFICFTFFIFNIKHFESLLIWMYLSSRLRLKPRVWSHWLLPRPMRERKTWSRSLGCRLCSLTSSCGPSPSSRVTVTSCPKCSPWQGSPWMWWRVWSCWLIILRYLSYYCSVYNVTVTFTAHLESNIMYSFWVQHQCCKCKIPGPLHIFRCNVGADYNQNSSYHKNVMCWNKRWGAKWLRKRLHSSYYKSRYQQNDFGAVISICLFLNYRLTTAARIQELLNHWSLVKTAWKELLCIN